MRRALLLSAGLHALALGWAAGLRLPALAEAGQPARIEVIFGAGTASASPRAPSPAAEQPGTQPASASAPAFAAPDPGLHPKRPDPTMLPARDAPGNRGPDYPAQAWRLHQQGTVLLRLQIGADGAVTGVETLHSSGTAALDAAAVAALSRWRFLPATRDGQPVSSTRDQPVEFVLQ